jgi:endonuclease/exonuclease/phosphatase (EEP) superfamily protein YafD
MEILVLICKWAVLLYGISSLIPVFESDMWWIRIWDFPRLQLLTIGILCGLLYFTQSNDALGVKSIFLIVLLVGIGFDLYRIAPYSPLWAPESLEAKNKNLARKISFLAVNVLQDNQDPKKLLHYISKKKPQVILLLEVNQRWFGDLKELKKSHPHSIQHPLENEYGIALYSALPLENAVVKFLIESDVPSIETTVILASKEKIKVFALHPKPPRPQDGPTTERDAELVMIAKAVQKESMPVVVLGDLNDVAWSHTTRLFTRISGLLDPRIGRGPFATFPAKYPLLRFPLDYVFHSKELRLVDIQVLGEMGSDHLPIFVFFSLEPDGAHKQSKPKPNDEDQSEANELLKTNNTLAPPNEIQTSSQLMFIDID